MQLTPTLSIIIVNYNSIDFLSQALISIFNSNVNFGYEVIVVDNNSSDGSVDFIREYFTKVGLIQLTENNGFGRANNVAFQKAKGKYFLLLNPDTILQENTLQTMLDFMEENPDVGISGCKILNPDGSLQLACRRGIPTPWVAFTKLFGLQAIFPNLKLFGQYNQTFRNPNETYFVDAVSGSFMFVRSKVIEQINSFDESFFMYGEDLDFCYRAKLLGWKIAYVHSTSIIHYKGRSARRSSIDEIRKFYDAMEIFAKKHFGGSTFLLTIIKLGILLRMNLAKISVSQNKSRNSYQTICFLISSKETLDKMNRIFDKYPKLKNVSSVILFAKDNVENIEGINYLPTIDEIGNYLRTNRFDIFFVMDKLFPYFEFLQKVEKKDMPVKELRFAYDFPELVMECFARNDLL